MTTTKTSLQRRRSIAKAHRKARAEMKQEGKDKPYPRHADAYYEPRWISVMRERYGEPS